MTLGRTLGELKAERSGPAEPVRDEMRRNLLRKMRRARRSSRACWATTTPSCRRSSTRSCRGTTSSCWACAARPRPGCCAALTTLLDPQLPAVAGCEIHDDPFRPICRRCRDLLAERGDDTPIAWLTPEERYVEKLATPDVTIADMIGDIDPIRAARGGHDLATS